MKAHTAGDASAQWEEVVVPPEQQKLIRCPLMAPVSDTEIAFLRFGHPPNIGQIPGEITPLSPGGVVIYNVVKETIT